MKAWWREILPGIWSNALPRGVALFFGAFALINLLGELRSPGFDANVWWIDLRLLPPMVERFLVSVVAFLLLVFAIRPPSSSAARWSIAGIASGLALLALFNAGQFYRELIVGNIRSGFPIPLSFIVCAAFSLVAWAALPRRSAGINRTSFPAVLVCFSLCLFLFPILQVVCFGKTDYRRKADIIVVLGARAYSDGRPSDALADRVRTAVDLYKQGYARKLLMSGGPGDGAIHETEAMKRYAVSLGVAEGDILRDELGLNTQATVENTEAMFPKIPARRILVVSHFYHLPRIKMAYQRDGWDVFTVPAEEAYFLRQTPYMVLREVAGLWVYYLRPLT